MGSDSIEDVLREQFRFEIAEPEVFPETVTGDGFDAAVFTVGIGIVYRAVDEVVQACEDAQRTGQPVVAVGICLVIDVPMLLDAIPHNHLRPVVNGQPVIQMSLGCQVNRQSNGEETKSKNVVTQKPDEQVVQRLTLT